MSRAAPWLITLICGASGVGKSRAAAALAGRYGVPVAEEDQLVANYRSREPHDDEQRHRARVSILVGARLATRARQLGMPVVPARPWADQLDRIDSALRGAYLAAGAPPSTW